MNNIPGWVWLAGLAAAAYAAYEWAQTQCATAGSSLYGGSICGMLFPVAVVAAVPVAVAPATTTAANVAMLQAYGLPVDAVPTNTYPVGNDCSVVNPIKSGYNPTPGAPFFSASLAQNICGPQSLWQTMTPSWVGTAQAGVSGVPAHLIHRGSYA